MQDIAIPVASTIASGGATALIVKFAIDRWLKQQQRDSEILREVEKTVAVLNHQIQNLEKDINAMGSILRSMRK